MITAALMDFLAGLVIFLAGLLPSFGPPGWFSGIGSHLGPVWAAGAGLGAWIPWPLVGTVLAFVGGSFVLGIVIKVTRIVASFFTAGGGSAA